MRTRPTSRRGNGLARSNELPLGGRNPPAAAIHAAGWQVPGNQFKRDVAEVVSVQFAVKPRGRGELPEFAAGREYLSGLVDYRIAIGGREMGEGQAGEHIFHSRDIPLGKHV